MTESRKKPAGGNAAASSEKPIQNLEGKIRLRNAAGFFYLLICMYGKGKQDALAASVSLLKLHPLVDSHAAREQHMLAGFF
ncbi:hypothetical protein EV130_108281 [Rhizobium azibense]|uniref:Uncharacterized protein n=1 Tax=Rhizobium azibense TaxID=1136135 RepID=A0A4R3QX11_9HYPH|nr:MULTISPECIES: hypothetical protein [Rhizobium]TCU23136.1 hypothetical protein EV130_108281 [Rhizobium azibense]